MNPVLQRLQSRLHERQAADLYRVRRTLESPQQPAVRLGGKPLLSFCSNDYLGLANHPEVIGAFREGAARYGVGSGASHLVSGHSLPHHALEAALAEFTGRSRALLFSSGYMANVGVLAAILSSGDQVFEDRLNHASLLDGGLFSGARFRRYPHLDTGRLAGMLEKQEDDAPRLIVTDGVFSMDGDVAPLQALVQLAGETRSLLMMDDAHGFGVLGSTGGGLAQQVSEGGFPVNEDNLQVLVGTLGKAFGTSGAFVAGSEILIESLVQFCRPYIYTTAMPPAVAVATLASLRILREESWRRTHLQKLVNRFRADCLSLGFELTDSLTPIQGLLLGSATDALQASRTLEDAGILVTAIRPPTVPEGTSRLRITFSAAHSEADLCRLLDALSRIAPGKPA